MSLACVEIGTLFFPVTLLHAQVALDCSSFGAGQALTTHHVGITAVAIQMTLVAAKFTNVVLAGTGMVAIPTGRTPRLDIALLLSMARSQAEAAQLSFKAVGLGMTGPTTPLADFSVAPIGWMTLSAATMAFLKFETIVAGVAGLAALVANRCTTSVLRVSLSAAASTGH